MAEIGTGAFKGCKALTSMVIPNSVTTIGNAVFSGCTALTSVVLSDAITKIGMRMFYKCEGLQTVIISRGVKEFAHAVFDGCDQLKAIYYRGTQQEWEQIKITEGPPFVESTNPQFEGVTVYFLSESWPTEEGNYWHYVDGIPTPWKYEE